MFDIFAVKDMNEQQNSQADRLVMNYPVSVFAHFTVSKKSHLQFEQANKFYLQHTQVISPMSLYSQSPWSASYSKNLWACKQ